MYSSYAGMQPHGIIRVDMIEIIYTHFILSTHDDDQCFLLDLQSSRAWGRGSYIIYYIYRDYPIVTQIPPDITPGISQ